MSAVLEAREPTARYLEVVQPALVNQFGLLATAPGGVARLRELILRLAVQGKVVPQDPTDETAHELLEKMRGERDRLIETGTVKPPKLPKGVVEDEAPYEIPAGWCWAPLADLVRVLNGRAYAKHELLDAGPTPVLRVGNLFTSNHWYYSNLCLEPDKLCKPGDLLFAWSASFGPFIWDGPEAIFHYHIWKLDPIAPQLFDTQYLHLFLREKTAEIKAAGHGVSMVHLTKEKMERIPVPWPPLAEQARIVARVDELMRLCDALEAQGRLEAEQHARLLGTLLDTLTDSSTPEELAANWQRVADQFDLLLDRPEAVDALEQTILQLAVRGLLVQQDPSDEPASELLGRIAVDRSRLIAEGKVAKRATSEATAQVVAPFDIPTSWLWVEFADYIHELCTGPFGSVIHKEDYVQGGVPLINPSHMIDGAIRHDPNVSVSRDLANRLGAYRLSAGDVLMARRGEVGRYALVTEREAGWLCGTGSFFVRLASFCNRDYFGLMLEDPRLRAHLLGESVGATMTNLNQRILLQAPIAVPPLNEQARIVARVAEIRRLCADLRNRLERGSRVQTALAVGLVDQALASQ
ncbi:MAG: restriction endonuclease subunit S [Proteobacteria bacterium]|nr:restriction endonuclease subunit S [Pseudomonadota bacterium]